MTASTTCARCDRTLADGAVICRTEARDLATQLLQAAGHAEDAEAVITRQTRYGDRGRNGSHDGQLPNLTASARLHRAAGTIDHWATALRLEPQPWRVMTGPLCPPWRPGEELRRGNRCTHDSCRIIRERTPPPALAEALRLLACHTEDLRRHPEAGQAFTELHRVADDLAHLVDRPAEKDLVGVCDCGRVLYAPRGKVRIVCPNPTCRLPWNVAESREILAAALRQKLFTASECARLATFWHERTQPQIRALITTWTRPDRPRLHPHGWIPNDDYTGDGEEPEGWATYLLGDVLDLLAQTPRRQRQGAAA